MNCTERFQRIMNQLSAAETLRRLTSPRAIKLLRWLRRRYAPKIGEWKTLPYGMRGKHIDIPGIGRYVIRPESKGSRTWRAYLNSTRTQFSGIGEEPVRAMVERFIRSRDA